MQLRTPIAALAVTGVLAGLVVATPTSAAPGAGPSDRAGDTVARPTAKKPTAIGKGGAVTTVDPEATAAGLRVLKAGGNAVDAAVAAAATLGVTEPYSAGIGGGGYFVYYNARSGKVRTIDGRETAPNKMPQDAFIDPATGAPYTFTPDLVTSGVSVGTPGTLATWDKALANWGTLSLGDALAPATKVARRGFKVDPTFRQQTLDNLVRFTAFPDTKKLFLPKGDAPKVGSIFRNPELADTYDLIADKGISAFYRGPLARLMSDVVRKPRTTKKTKLPVPKGYLTARDLRDYKVRSQKATRSTYRGHDVYGMAPSSSGGTTIGEALNILERYNLAAMTPEAALHHYLEASALAFADRGKYVGDPAYVDVPVKRLLDKKYAAERACSLDQTRAAVKPVAAGDVTSYDGICGPAARQGEVEEDTENISTTNLTVADKWGNVVEYTLTIEQTGGSGITVPGHGFLLNNELTDFSTVYDAADPNRIQPGKRPRSSMSPTIILKDGKPFLALGSPGGSTIITTVLQMIVNRIDLGMTIEEAIAAPRASQRNTASVTAEPAFIDAYGAALTALGHTLAPAGDAFTSAAEIGAATAIEFGPKSLLTAVAEPTRRGTGSAAVVDKK
ncbi:gamma-glutamyltranspeptidase / glutathione hydrolase [Nocardioides exalbidus]|uniref:Glutathione hydrolase proenzyme n=1 Tax=Nocardioides exalbidus TaxID=402596 RepID=A0A1H4KTZ0_9ACTN|nr:gamma-glutamyltransferase [Nocardioides exalbidus]SEB61585.1 gamma-glutamyltranspeptidase / glutathione hydrolase [Nocardioides exalbidus]